MSSQPIESLDKNTISQQSSLLRTASPATSISNLSSQGSTLSTVHKVGNVGRERESRDVAITNGGQDTRLSNQPSTARDRPTSAPKRMLNGEVKSATGGQITSPVDERKFSRRPSRESQAAEVGHLQLIYALLLTVSQLKDRLAFAKYKLDHGYQDLRIADVEAITSQQGSPVSANSDPRNASPRKHHALHPSTSYGSKSTAQSPQYSQSQQNHPGPRSAQLPSSYDDFWNSQSQNRPPILAPPADLRPRNMYQSHDPLRSPPNLHPLAAPTTPQRRPQINVRSPSEQRACEADAVEALAFMSSPNNSGYYPKIGQGLSGSPTRSQSQNKATATQPAKLSTSQDSQPPAKRPMTQQEQDRSIDSRLDAMSDDSDEDDR